MRKNSQRILWISLAVLVLLVVVAFAGVSMWVRGFLRSEDFRRLVEAKTGEALHSTATYSPFTWEGDSVFADSLDAEGNPGAIIDKIRADQVRAEVNWRAMWDGAWRVDRIDVVHFVGTFRPGTPQGGDEGPQTPPRPSGLAGLLPQRFELGQLNIAQTHLGFLGADSRESITLHDSAIVVRPDGAGWSIEGKKGTFTLPNLPIFDVTSFRSRIQGSTFFLTDAALRLGENGKITASGEFANDSKLRVQWSQVDVATFLDPAWKSRLIGPFSGTAVLEWPVAGLSAGTATGTFRMTDAVLQKLDALDQIATFTGAPQFRVMVLQEFSGNYAWNKSLLTLTNLIMESKGLMKIEGGCTIAADGALAGSMRVGVTPQSLQWLPGSRERVFKVSREGYLWTDVRVGGTVKNPSEDLSGRLASAMKDEVISQGEKVLDVLPGPAKEGAKGVLDMLKPLLP